MSLYTGPPQTPVRTDTANNPTNHLNNSGTSIQANRGTPSLYRRQHTPAQPRADPTSSYPRTYTENGSINTHDNGVNSNLSLHQATSNTISSNPALPIPSQSGFQPTHPTPSFQRSTLSTTNPPRRPTAPLPPVSTSSSPGWLSRYHETSPEREIIRQSYQPFWRSYSPFDPYVILPFLSMYRHDTRFVCVLSPLSHCSSAPTLQPNITRYLPSMYLY